MLFWNLFGAWFQVNSLRNFFYLLLIAIAILSSYGVPAPSRPNTAVVFDGEDLSASISKALHAQTARIASLRFSTAGHLLLALARVLRLVSQNSDSSPSRILFQKLSSRLRDLVNDLEDTIVSQEQSEVCAPMLTRLPVPNAPADAKPRNSQPEHASGIIDCRDHDRYIRGMA
jgi:hypothetical protein